MDIRAGYCYWGPYDKCESNLLFIVLLLDEDASSSLPSARWLKGLGEPGRVFPSAGEFLGVSHSSTDEVEAAEGVVGEGVIANLLESSKDNEVTIGLDRGVPLE